MNQTACWLTYRPSTSPLPLSVTIVTIIISSYVICSYSGISIIPQNIWPKLSPNGTLRNFVASCVSSCVWDVCNFVFYIFFIFPPLGCFMVIRRNCSFEMLSRRPIIQIKNTITTGLNHFPAISHAFLFSHSSIVDLDGSHWLLNSNENIMG